ncbi:MAG: enoyl-CoA hydratase/isomerase family protein [Minwuia sp.]|uniref:enoyl-CoA hydratase/isomerase family protein n=1 Tax=Minwuia sp. TaxID=2493630 RepID=UPI003A839E23
MKFDTLLFDVADGVATITLNRPDEGNACNLAMMEDLFAAATECDQNDAIRAVILTGAGKMFCVGGDLGAFIESGDRVGTLLSGMTKNFHGAISIFNRMNAPVICAVNGTAAGGGMSLAASCDLVLAAASAKFAMAYTAAGLTPDGSSSYFLPRLIGLRRAKELMLTNRRLSAEEALGYDLIDRVVPDGELMAEAGKLAAQFAAGPTSAYGGVKKLLAGTFAETLESQMTLEARTIAERARNHDAQEGLQAFFEKRKPNFRGV